MIKNSVSLILKLSDIVFWPVILLFVFMSVAKHSTIETVNQPRLLFRLDYLLHFLAYAILILMTFAGEYHRKKKWNLFNYRILIVILTAALTEFIQLMIPWRKFNIWDLIMNGSGVCLGMILYLIFLAKIVQRVTPGTDQVKQTDSFNNR